MTIGNGNHLDGDRSAKDVIDNFDLHSNETDMLKHHTTPTKLVGDAEKMDVLNADGTIWVLSDHVSHAPVTLDANADSVLSLSDQQLGLDTKAANLIFYGPTTGAETIPTFR